MFPGVQQQSEQKVISSTQYSFAGGINTSVPPDRIADNECWDLVNMRFNDQDSLLPRNGTETSLSQIAAADITDKITSVFSAYYENAGTPVIRDIFTTNAGNIYTFTGGVATLRGSGYGTFYWQWKMYGDLAIGTNRLTVPRTINQAGTDAILSVNAPSAKYIEVWNDRVWLTGVNNPNTLYGSALGNEADWTTTGVAGRVIIDIEPQDGDFITGICAFRERLFIFKRNRIYTVQAVGGAFPTDSSALSVELYSQNIGCLSAYSIQPVLDDILFLSEYGVASLVASERVGDFNSALLSRKITIFKGLRSSSIQDYEISACVMPETNQYWLLFPAGTIGETTLIASITAREQAYILDYTRIQEGVVRWSRFIGAAAGLVMTIRRTLTEDQVKYYIGGRIDGDATTYRIWLYIASSGTSGALNDDYSVDRAIEYRVVTKLYDFNLPSVRKEFHRQFFDFTIHASSHPVAITVTYYFDARNTESDSWTISPSSPITGALTSVPVSFRTNVKYKYGTIGRRGMSVLLAFQLVTLNKGFGLKSIATEYSLLPARRVRQ